MEKVLTIKKLREIMDAIPIEKDELLVCYIDGEYLRPYEVIGALTTIVGNLIILFIYIQRVGERPRFSATRSNVGLEHREMK